MLRGCFKTMLKHRTCVRRLSVWNELDDYLVLTVKDKVLFKPTNRKSSGFQEIFGNESYIQPTLFSSSDNEYGGESSCQFETIEAATIDNSDSQNGGDAESNFLRFKGLLNFDDNMKEITKASGGYCALKFNYPKLIDLRDYVAFELTLRSKNPIFMTVNMTCETYVLGDIFQIQIDLKGSSEWRKIYLPFSFFFLTRRGIEYDENRLNDNLMVESLGMLLRENRIGNFELDIKEIKAVHKVPRDVERKLFSRRQ